MKKNSEEEEEEEEEDKDNNNDSDTNSELSYTSNKNKKNKSTKKLEKSLDYDYDDIEDDIDNDDVSDSNSINSDVSEYDHEKNEEKKIDNITNLELNNTIYDNVEYDKENIIMEKYSNNYKNNYIINNHPECLSKNYNEIKNLANIIKNENNIIIDEFHKTLPILSKYEKTKILGIRVKQLNNNSKPYIEIDENIIDNYIIANMELKEKKLPFIIQRPIQNRFEYWHIKDLEIL